MSVKSELSLKDMRSALLDQMITFLWRQWSSLGVLGESGTEDKWIIDPESLLIFSLQMGRYEPRLFDEILAWLTVNGQWLDTSRLKGMLSQQDPSTVRVVGGSLQYMLAHGQERKWQNAVKLCQQLFEKQPTVDMGEPLFKEKSGKPHPIPPDKKFDQNFKLFRIYKPSFEVTREVKEVPVNSCSNLRFQLRALFGTGARSEALLYLLTHEGGRSRDMAEAVGMFWLTIHQALLELSRSGLVLTRSKGKKVEYWVSEKRWWEFLAAGSGENSSRPKWLNWMAIFSALSTIWKTVDEVAASSKSEYMKGSKLQDSLEVLFQEFTRAGYDLPHLPTPGLPSDLHQKSALQFLSGVLDLSHG